LPQIIRIGSCHTWLASSSSHQLESHLANAVNLEGSVRSRCGEGGLARRDLIEAGLSEPAEAASIAMGLVSRRWCLVTGYGDAMPPTRGCRRRTAGVGCRRRCLDRRPESDFVMGHSSAGGSAR
jgi:hypothetical protein